jgi:hypothetical protein
MTPASADPPHRQRSGHPSLVASIALALGLLAATPAATQWNRLDSPNFVVVGDVPARDLRQVAGRFEAFREILNRVFTSQVTAGAVPTVVFVFSSDRVFKPFRPVFQGKPVELAGYFASGRNASYIAMRRDLDEHGMRVVFHEYAHLLIANAASATPLWLNEGLAEFYSTFTVTGGGREALIGTAIPQHVLLLRGTRRLALEELLGVTHDSPLYNEGERRSIFYAQSWALTHMVMLGKPSRVAQLQAYLQRTREGVAGAEAWQQAFGSDRIDEALDSYLSNLAFSAYRIKFADKLAAFGAPARALSAGEAEAHLALLLAQQQRYDEAARRLDAVSPTGSETAWSAVARATLDEGRNDHESARKRLAGIDAVNDWLAAYFAAAVLVDAIEAPGVPPDAAIAGAAQRMIDAARSGRGDIPHLLVKNASLALCAEGEVPEAVVAAVHRARQLAPGRFDYAFLHARLLARQKAFAAARTVLRPLIAPATADDVRAAATSMLAYVDYEEQRHAGRHAAPPPPTEVESPDTDRDHHDRGGTGSVFIPIYRTLERGEQRVEGLLQRIECVPSGTLLHVRTNEGTRTLPGLPLPQMEFLTYRDDLEGAVACDDPREPMLVYVTLAPAPQGDFMRAVVVEFLAPASAR